MSPFEITGPADIGRDRTLLFWLDGSLTISARPRLRLALHWLREIALGHFASELYRQFDSEIDACVHATLSAEFLAAVALDEDGRLRLRLSKWRASSLRVEARPATDARPDTLLRTIFALDAEAPGGAATRLADVIHEQAFAALEKKCAAELSRRTARGEALVDCSFDFTPEGLAAYRSALEGNLAANRLAEALEGGRTIEVHLPAIDRNEWAERWSMLAHAQAVVEEDGRVFVHGTPGRAEQRNARQIALALAAPLLHPECSGFEIGFTDRRTSTAAQLAHWLPLVLRPYGFGPEPWEWLASAPAGEVEAAVSLSVPGSSAGAWLRAPGEKERTFFEVYSKVSVAAQQALRRWLPYTYFNDLTRFEDLPLAYPLIFYRGTYPCFGRPRCDFAHDLVSPEDPGIARPWAVRPLASSMTRAERLLIAAGRGDLARYYNCWRARDVLAGILARPRFINELVTNDAFFIDRLVALGLAGRDLASSFGVSSRRAMKELSLFAGGFTAAFNRKLRRLYGGQDFVSLGSLLLVETTRALAGALGGQAAISATLHFSAQGREQTFVNRGAGFSPRGA